MSGKEEAKDDLKRRAKVYAIPVHAALGMMNWRRKPEPGSPGVCVALPDFPELPEGYVVDGMTHSWERDAILVRILHPSFPVVEPYERFPEVVEPLAMTQAVVVVAGPLEPAEAP